MTWFYCFYVINSWFDLNLNRIGSFRLNMQRNWYRWLYWFLVLHFLKVAEPVANIYSSNSQKTDTLWKTLIKWIVIISLSFMTFNLTECSKNTIYSVFYFTVILVQGCAILKSSGRLWNNVLLFQVRSCLLQQVIDKPNSARLTELIILANLQSIPVPHWKCVVHYEAQNMTNENTTGIHFQNFQQFLPPQISLSVLFREQVMEQNSKLVNSNSVSEVEYLHCTVHHLCIVFNYI